MRTSLKPLNLAKCHDLQFLPPDYTRFPALKLAYQVCKRGGILPAALNAANEVAVEAFLEGTIRFPEISLVVAETVHRAPQKEIADINTILEADLAARLQAESVIQALQIKSEQRLAKNISAESTADNTL